jgi:hypothetical protein
MKLKASKGVATLPQKSQLGHIFGRGPAHLFKPIVFYSGGNAFFQRSEFGKKLDRQATERSQLFDITVNMIANPVKLPGRMPTICSEISQFDNHHAMLNHFQCGMTMFDFQFLVDFWLFSEKNSVGGDANKNKDDNLLLPSSAHSSTPGKGAATTPMQLMPRCLPCLCSPLLRLVGL